MPPTAAIRPATAIRYHRHATKPNKNCGAIRKHLPAIINTVVALERLAHHIAEMLAADPEPEEHQPINAPCP